MLPLSDALEQYKHEITQYLFVPERWWPRVIRRIVRRERRNSKRDFSDEQVWTFLIGCGYAVAGEHGVALLTENLTGSRQKEPADPRIWFEILPRPPRTREGNTHIDLALGAIDRRGTSAAGIELAYGESPWICFCEMKWYADISLEVSHDVHRNQLARVIDNALSFQSAGTYAERVYVTLVTPTVFRDAVRKSRLYQYKFEEYLNDPARLLWDLDASGLKRRDQDDWSYPADLPGRIDALTLRWVSYDELFDNLPGSPLAEELRAFWDKHGNYHGRRART